MVDLAPTFNAAEVTVRTPSSNKQIVQARAARLMTEDAVMPLRTEESLASAAPPGSYSETAPQLGDTVLSLDSTTEDSAPQCDPWDFMKTR